MAHRISDHERLLSDAQERVSEAANVARERVAQAAGVAKETLTEAATTAREHLSDAALAAEQRAKALRNTATRSVRRAPLQGVAIAAAVGFVIGVLCVAGIAARRRH
jgi:ElaB/YqjD/DUF883 family membrane-anchored ribosome-binding protein